MIPCGIKEHFPLVLLLLMNTLWYATSDEDEEAKLEACLKQYDEEGRKTMSRVVAIQRNLFQDFNDQSVKNFNEISCRAQDWLCNVRHKLQAVSVENITDENSKIARTNILHRTGPCANGSLWSAAQTELTRMLRIYNKEICALNDAAKDCSVKWSLYSDIFNKLANASNPLLLLYIWQEWREIENLGQMRASFATAYGALKNASIGAGYADLGDWWRHAYSTTENFDVKNASRTIFYDLLPLYEELHAYVKHKLANRNSLYIPLIGSHLVQSLFGDQWQQLYRWTRPDKSLPNLDITAALKETYRSVSQMFDEIKKYFSDIGLHGEIICRTSCMYEKPPKEAKLHPICKPTFYDLYDDNDDWSYTVSMCGQIDSNTMGEMFRLIGQGIYAREYSEQKMYFRQPANAGLFSAIGEAIALSYFQPKTLNETYNISISDTELADVDFLYRQALLKLPSVMYSYATDLWRWQLFRSDDVENRDWVKMENSWWTTMNKYMGLANPRPSNVNMSDFLVVPEVILFEPHIDSLFSTIFQFQIYEYACEIVNHKDALHKCTFGKKKKISQLFEQLMNVGSEKEWSLLLNETLHSNLNSSSLLKYFQPLHQWLIMENDKTSACRGWYADEEWPREVLLKLSPKRCKKEPPAPPPPPPTEGPEPVTKPDDQLNSADRVGTQWCLLLFLIPFLCLHPIS
ncbi:Angiotensin-converting enzyme [Trichinella britovi]|uniref:Angiotensin-converting enzyme n=1 Tax=Trichinella britovi TaxID=45882 RepID=A0A0V1CFE9_TRIBR|nr:Angiotensin-converting enzyme [Trichinella britovi]